MELKLETTNVALKAQLLRWTEDLVATFALPNPSAERTDAIIAFCRTFVPPDVTEDDIEHFSGNLISDEVSCIRVFCSSSLGEVCIISPPFIHLTKQNTKNRNFSVQWFERLVSVHRATAWNPSKGTRGKRPFSRCWRPKNRVRHFTLLYFTLRFPSNNMCNVL